MTKLLMMTIALMFVLETPNARSETKKFSEERIEELANDNDPLTGLWHSNGDAAMTNYMVFEKQTDTEYAVFRNGGRYAVDTWTSKIKRDGNRVYLWNYNIDGQTLALTENHNQAYIIRDGKLDDAEYTHFFLMSSKSEEDYLRDSSWVSEQSFETGERYFERKIAQIKKLESRIPKNFKWSEKLPNKDSISEFLTLAIEESETDKFVIAKIESFEYPNKLSGYCGASENESYYWTHLQNVKGNWQIADDWLVSFNQCLDGGELSGVYNTQSQENYIKITDRNYNLSKCYAYNSSSLVTKPRKCSDNDILYMNTGK